MSEIDKVLKNAEQEMFDLNHPYVGSEHLLLSILKLKDKLCNFLEEYNLTYNSFKKELVRIVGKGNIKSKKVLYTPLLRKIISNANNIAKKEKTKVNSNHLFLSILEEGEGIAIRLLLSMDIDIDYIYDKLSNHLFKNLLVYEIGSNLNEKVFKDEIVVGRDNEIEELISILLRKNKSNPVLIGEAGVGKTAIVEELARRINNKIVPQALQDKVIVMLEMGFLVAGTKYRGEFEERLTKIINEIKENKHIILFIDEIHTMIGAGGAEGAIDASNILKPYLAREDIKCIGATTRKEYLNSIANDKALQRRFQEIYVSEPNKDETLLILKKVKKQYEKHYQISINNKNLTEIISFADKYIHNKNNPDKSIELLDSVCSKIKLKDKKEIDKLDILEVISSRTRIPLIKNKEIKDNLKIPEKLQKKLNEHNYEKCLSIFLSGSDLIYKKEAINEISNIYFNQEKYINLDLSEYSDPSSVSKLIGTYQGYVGYNDDYIFSKIKTNPYQLICINNHNKGSKKVLSLIENIITNGVISDAKGEDIYFNNTVLIINSNENKTNPLGFKNKLLSKNIKIMDLVSIVVDCNENSSIKS